MRVLVAEDSKMMSEYLSSILQKLGFDAIDVAKDGREAVRLLGSSQYNLIILDRNMPGMSGVEVLQNLRYSPIPISAPILIRASFYKQRHPFEFSYKYTHSSVIVPM